LQLFFFFWYVSERMTEAINRQGEEWADEGLIEVICRAASLSASEITPVTTKNSAQSDIIDVARCCC
jgi:hypothetical protein